MWKWLCRIGVHKWEDYYPSRRSVHDYVECDHCRARACFSSNSYSPIAYWWLFGFDNKALYDEFPRDNLMLQVKAFGWQVAHKDQIWRPKPPTHFNCRCT